jgi:hypothetical protein
MIEAMIDNCFTQVAENGCIYLNFVVLVPQFTKEILNDFFGGRFVRRIPTGITAKHRIVLPE